MTVASQASASLWTLLTCWVSWPGCQFEVPVTLSGVKSASEVLGAGRSSSFRDKERWKCSFGSFMVLKTVQLAALTRSGTTSGAFGVAVSDEFCFAELPQPKIPRSAASARAAAPRVVPGDAMRVFIYSLCGQRPGFQQRSNFKITIIYGPVEAPRCGLLNKVLSF